MQHLRTTISLEHTHFWLMSLRMVEYTVIYLRPNQWKSFWHERSISEIRSILFKENKNFKVYYQNWIQTVPSTNQDNFNVGWGSREKRTRFQTWQSSKMQAWSVALSSLPIAYWRSIRWRLFYPSKSFLCSKVTSLRFTSSTCYRFFLVLTIFKGSSMQ